MNCFHSFFEEHNEGWSESERQARWTEANAKSAARRQRKAEKRNDTIPVSNVGIEARLESYRRRYRGANDAPLWSLGMVVVWIMWRDFGRVTEMQEEPHLSDARLCIKSAIDALAGVKHLKHSTIEAFNLISLAAQKGDISFTGVGANSAPRLIDRTEWAYIAKPSDRFTQVTWKAGGDAYRDLYANREEILNLWPAPPACSPWTAPLPDRSGGYFGSISDERFKIVERGGLSHGGRPRIQDELLRSYQKLFPGGHAKLTWKAVAQAIGNETGEEFHIDTLKRALGRRGEAVAKSQK
ncbi:MAG: hypothetical protein J0I23_17660 [Rhizobiales bacterium]|nr:hypothetical protein [Hyphomicrobiales bacterium]